jgi:RluA family pseudouridine synthase
MKGIELLAENNDYLFVNKPAGLLTIPDRFNEVLPSLSRILQEKFGSIFTVHRLDKDTSGIVLFARNEQTHQFFSQQFENRIVQKFYYALVHGKMELAEKDTITLPIAEHPVQKGSMIIHKKGKTAVTDYEVVETFTGYSWLQLQIHTGRTHQIRVHLQAIGHPVVADELYGNGIPLYLSSIKRNFRLSKKEETEHPLLARLALHASRISIRDLRGEMLTYEAPLPKDLQAALYQLRKIKGPTSF